ATASPTVAASFTTMVTAAPVSHFPGAARLKSSRSQLRLDNAPVTGAGFGGAPEQFFPKQVRDESRRFGERHATESSRTRGRLATPRDACATLRQFDALK